MKLTGLKVAVTGGAGFIGSHLVDQLLENQNQVIVIDNFLSGKLENLEQQRGNKNLKILKMDVRDALDIRNALKDVDIVFHLATHCVRLSIADPRTNHDINATGTFNVLEAAKYNHVKRFIYCSSSEVFGNPRTLNQNAQWDLSEDSLKCPTTIYGASKLVGEHYTLTFNHLYGLPSIVVRPFNTYGPRSHVGGAYGEVIPRFSFWLRAQKAPIIFGNGNQTRDFTFVSDTVKGLIHAAQCDALIGSDMNLAYGAEVSINEIARILHKRHPDAPKTQYTEKRPGDIERLGADTKKAKKMIHWAPEVSIEEGIEKYLSWLDEKQFNYKQMISGIVEENWRLENLNT